MTRLSRYTHTDLDSETIDLASVHAPLPDGVVVLGALAAGASMGFVVATFLPTLVGLGLGVLTCAVFGAAGLAWIQTRVTGRQLVRVVGAIEVVTERGANVSSRRIALGAIRRVDLVRSQLVVSLLDGERVEIPLPGRSRATRLELLARVGALLKASDDSPDEVPETLRAMAAERVPQ